MEVVKDQLPRDSQRGAELRGVDMDGVERRKRGYSIDHLIEAANTTFPKSNGVADAPTLPTAGSENSSKTANHALASSKVEMASPPETKKLPNTRRSRSATFSYSPFVPPESSFATNDDDDNDAGGTTSGIRTLSWLASMADDEVSAAKFLSDLCRQPNTPASTSGRLCSVGTGATTRLPFSSLSPLRKTPRVILTDKFDLENSSISKPQLSGHQRFNGLRFGLGFDASVAESDFGNLSGHHESHLTREPNGVISTGNGAGKNAGAECNVGGCDGATYDPSAHKDVSPSKVATYWDGLSASIPWSGQRSRERSYSVPDLSFGTDDVKRMVGAYTAEERRRRIERFLHKRSRRVWVKKVKYDVRKNFADSRVRVRGRFIRKVEGGTEEILPEHEENVAAPFDPFMT